MSGDAIAAAALPSQTAAPSPSVTRAALRLAQTGWCALATAGRLRLLRVRTGRVPTTGEQAALLRRVAQSVLRTHGLTLIQHGQAPQGPALLACNHVSYLDPLVVMAAAPSLPIAKAEVAGWPVVGPIARACGVQFVRRGDATSGASSLRGAARTLTEQVSVLTFPEGTTSAAREPMRFRAAALHAARVARVPVIPVAIVYERPQMAWVGDQTFVPHFLRLAAEGGGNVRLSFGAPLHPDAFDSVTELADAARTEVCRLLAAGQQNPLPRGSHAALCA